MKTWSFVAFLVCLACTALEVGLYAANGHSFSLAVAVWCAGLALFNLVSGMRSSR